MEPSTDNSTEIPCPEADNETLISLIESRNVDRTLELLDKGQTFSQNELDGALLSACKFGHKYLIYELVNLGADVQKKDTNGDTPLIICTKYGFTDLARFFIRKKVDINAINSVGDTALICCIRLEGSIEMVKLLLDQTGIDINHQNRDGFTALMKAIEVMDIDVIRLLLDKQEDTEGCGEKITNCKGETAQQIADKLGIGNVLRFLSKHKGKITSQILAAIEACDVDACSILIDCQLSYIDDVRTIIRDAFKELFVGHQKEKQIFNEAEVSILKLLLKYGADINSYNYYFDPMTIAIESGSYNVVEILCENGAKLDHGYSSRTKDPLKTAAETGRADLVELLLKHNATMNANRFSDSALEAALKHGHSDCAKLLMTHGATLDIEKALSTAVREQLPKYLNFLLLNFSQEVRNIVSTTARSNLLVSAARGGDLEIIRLLLDAGAHVNGLYSQKKTPLMESKNGAVVHLLVQRGAVVNKRRKIDNQISSPLTYILSCDGYRTTNTEEVVQALLENRANVNGKSCGGRTPLMMAASQEGRERIIQMLLEHGAYTSTTDGQGNTALLIAAEKNNTENLKSLLKHSKDSRQIVNFKNNVGLTTLMVACDNQNIVAVKELVDNNADVNIKDSYGNTALFHALKKICSKEDQILTTLINAGSSVNCQNNEGYSPLMLAAKHSKKYSLPFLIDSGADVNAVSSVLTNETALSLLLRSSYFDCDTLACLKCLLDHRAQASYASPDVVHKLILQGEVDVIPKLIQCGLGPVDVSPVTLHLKAHVNVLVSAVSPLFLALLKGNLELARYFVGNLFLTSSDVSSLILRKMQRVLETDRQQESLGYLEEISAQPMSLCYLEEISAQPMSLFILAFVSIQSAVRAGPGREDRVNSLPLPQVIRDRLLFKTEIIPLVITATAKSAVQASFILSNTFIDVSSYYGHNSSIDYYDYDDVYTNFSGDRYNYSDSDDY